MNREDLINALADRMVDNLDVSGLCEIAMIYLTEEYSKLTDEQLKAEAKEWAEDLLEDDDE